MKDKCLEYLKRIKPGGIQSMIMIVFTVISVLTILCMGIMMYFRFSSFVKQDAVESTHKLVEQTGESLEDYLVQMRQISDAAYYNVIKENDVSENAEKIQEGMKLLYEANINNLRSIAIYDKEGTLVTAEPVVSKKKGVDVTSQDWFCQALEDTVNIHFSTPHVQNLFDDGTKRYYWVLSSSRVVEITDGGDSYRGVLLVDMDYSGISRMMKQINEIDNGQYYYLCDKNGRIIYHPQQILINNGMEKENSAAIAGYKEGVYEETFEGKHRTVIVNTVSYTGWKLVGVIPDSIITHEMINIRQVVIMWILLMVMMLIVVNRIVSAKISRPILKLNDSVLEYEAGKEAKIYIGGSMEIRHLGESIQNSYRHNEQLMEEIVIEQTERRKSEMDALQSQINPHFLYNTLDSIIWLVEGERNDDATFMISQLARLFRISISKGHTVISVRDELQHVRCYVNIQKIRYKDGFSTVFDIDPSIEDCCAVKLTLQPLLENAINYGISEMDGSGVITVAGKRDGGDIVLSVTDNGVGIPEEKLELLLTDSTRVRKQGSGVGLVNVHNRIQILFGKEYGIEIESELDEGTTVSVRIPSIPFTQENQRIFEKGYLFSKEEWENKDEKEQ